MQDALAFVEAALAALEHSLGERGDGLRNAQFATVSPEGRPAVRTVVLRGFERSPGRAEIHSDARAGKIREIAHSRHVAILAWSPAARLQLRLHGVASLHRGDALARARWDGLPESARKPYGLAATPGDPLASPEDRRHLPPDGQFEQFVVIEVALASADVLRLEDAGEQTRALARFASDGLEATWIGA